MDTTWEFVIHSHLKSEDLIVVICIFFLNGYHVMDSI
jgi:hypothetical protein